MKSNNVKKRCKAYFAQRLIAYFIDMIVVTIISSLVTYPFVDNKSITKLADESNKVVENYLEEKTDIETYFNQSMDISYEQAKITGFSNIITIIILVLYFIVYQIYNNGQTIGKKIAKIKIVKNDDSDLTMNNMIIRELFNSFILVDILVAIFTLFGKNSYLYGSLILELIQYIFIIITVFMIFFRKDGRGLPDFIASTKVINLKDNLESEEVVCEN